MKCDVFDGSVVNGSRQPILFTFVLDKPPRYKVSCEPEAILYQKLHRSVLKSLTFSLEKDDHTPDDYIRETSNFFTISENLILCAMNELSKIQNR